VFHASRTLDVLADGYPDTSAPCHFTVVGTGQTSADVFQHLRATYLNARITTAIRGFVIQAQDDTHFVNELFEPHAPGWFHGQSPKFREQLLRRHHLEANTGSATTSSPSCTAPTTRTRSPVPTPCTC
jgi:L-ornithine N5-oxygenase